MLSEVGDPIMEDENERTNSESNRLKIPSTKNTSSKKKKENHSHYGSIKHPNMMMSDGTVSQVGRVRRSATSMQEYKEWQKKDCSYFFLKLDFEILKPILIYNYNREKMDREDRFVEAMISDANMLGSVYGKMDDDVLDQVNG